MSSIFWIILFLLHRCFKPVIILLLTGLYVPSNVMAFEMPRVPLILGHGIGSDRAPIKI